MHVLSMVHFMSRHQDGPVLLQKHVHDSQLYLWQHFRTQRHGSGQIRIIRTSSPRRQFACVTFHLAWLILLLGITGLVPLPTKSQWRSSFCGHAKCEKNNFHTLKSLFSCRPDTSIAIATKQPEETFSLGKVLFCSSSTQKVSPQPNAVGPMQYVKKLSQAQTFIPL